MTYLVHYGTPRHSGRYPWGSGEDPQRSKSIATLKSELKRSGMKETEIAEALGFNTTTELRARLHMEAEASYGAKTAMAARLKAKGYSNVKIGERMGVSPNTVKNLLSEETKERHDATLATKKMLKEQVDAKGMIDIGKSSNIHLGVTESKLQVSVKELELQGYVKVPIQIQQLGTQNKTTVKVLMSPEILKKAHAEYVVKNKEKWDTYTQQEKDEKVAYLYAVKNSSDIKLISDWSTDGGLTFKKVQPPVSIDSKRVMVRFDDDKPSGSLQDGVIQLRRGVADIALPPDTRYAQVRIAVVAFPTEGVD